MPNNIRRVFGIISYFPDADTDYNASVRKQRMQRCSELLTRLSTLWSNIDIIIIAQNWQDYQCPHISNKITLYKYERLGILQARRVLRQKFLDSDYDYLIMLDDDVVIRACNPEAYMHEVDLHPNGFGVIRHTNHPLNLCAVSRYIYSQLDLPDIDIERGEGYGDDVFVARCFAQYPDNAFDFPTDCIRETSLKLQLPSTWMSNSTFDRKFLLYLTEALVIDASRKPITADAPAVIDAVIPFVDSEDPAWFNEYIQTLGESPKIAHRYRSWGTLQYLLRGIAECMPFINKVFLIVARESQVPLWLNRDNVHVVYHSDFIPEEFLPTFNSCTIESFLYQIEGLSEYFLYFNDDIFPINPSQASDFFTGDKPHLRFRTHFTYDDHQVFRCQCRSSMDAIRTMLGLDEYPQGEIIIPEHGVFPILKSSASYVGEACQTVIWQSITRLRKSYNLNQYIYHYYQYFTGEYIDDFCPYMYMEIDEDIDDLRKIINIDSIRFVCLNDMDDLANYDTIRDKLHSIFREKFPNICKYEVRRQV